MSIKPKLLDVLEFRCVQYPDDDGLHNFYEEVDADEYTEEEMQKIYNREILKI